MKRAQGQPACTHSSVEAGESIIASAAEATDTWLLLEVPGGWSPKAPDTAHIPPVVRSVWTAVSAIPRARMQFIKRTPKVTPDRQIYVGWSGDSPEFYTWSLSGYEDLHDADIQGWLSGSLPEQAQRVDTPFYLVCTHGKRDECCAKYGLAVYRALQQRIGERVWQSSHIGGHRFAATLLAFPTGHCFGRLTPNDIETMQSSYDADTLFSLDHLRGRTAWSRAEQAAEDHLRRCHQWFGGGDISNIRTVCQDVDGSIVECDTPLGSLRVAVSFELGQEIFGSCFKTKTQTTLHWSCETLATSPA